MNVIKFGFKDSGMNEGVYETPSDIIERIEQNEGESTQNSSAVQEFSTYATLKTREPENVYQSLQLVGVYDEPNRRQSREVKVNESSI